MLKQKALRKMLITSITVVILLMIYLMPTNSKTSTNILDVDKKIAANDEEIKNRYTILSNAIINKKNVTLIYHKKKQNIFTIYIFILQKFDLYNGFLLY